MSNVIAPLVAVTLRFGSCSRCWRWASRPLAIRGSWRASVPNHVEMALAGGLAILVPGWAVAGALGLADDHGPVTAWGLVPLLGVMVWAIPGGMGLLVGVRFDAIAVVVLVAAAACLAARLPLGPPPVVDAIAMAGLGGLGFALGWQWQSILVGDALFHAGVIRKLLALSRPSESSIWPFLNGHPHAGYAFPLLHLPQARRFA